MSAPGSGVTPRGVRGRVVLRGLLAGLVTVGALVLLSFWTGPGRRMLVAFSAGPEPAAAERVEALEPRFDGKDARRERVPVTLVPILTGVPQPTDVSEVPGHPHALVVLSKTGAAHLRTEATGPTRVWFTVPVRTTSELGLLGLAFHPKFTENGLFFVNDNPESGELRTRISRWKVDPATLRDPVLDGVVLEVAQPYQNHNAGQLRFGPDGYLYVGLGDGGFRNDPHGHGQDPATLLGSMLRIDVDRPPYAVPVDNPFVGKEGFLPEIWAYGLRNPWRYSFDPRGRLIVADVGQGTLEEIDVVDRGDNLGWNVREGNRCFEPKSGCRAEGLEDPVWVYGRDEGISISGGVTWTAPGPLQGGFLFGDFGTGRLWMVKIPEDGSPARDVTALGRFGFQPVAFALRADGTALVAGFDSGAVYAIRPAKPE